MNRRPRRILLVGGGHSHVEVLRHFALHRDDAAALTLISPQPVMGYTGMMPGLVAGHYTANDTHIALETLAAWAGARFICDRVVAMDLYTRTVQLESGHHEAFDLVSLDVGSVPDASVPGARDHAFSVKPFDWFLHAWSILQQDAAEGSVRAIGVVGGGAGGVEILLAMQHRLQEALGATAPRFALITDQAHLLPQHSPDVRSRLGRILVQRGVVLHFDSGAVAVEPGAVVVTGGRRIAVDRVVWATSAAAQPWPAASGLACDERGFVIVDEHLRSTSHPFVFATGDCATQPAHPRPKAGVYAVRQGPPLALNLGKAAHDAQLATYIPQRRALALISTGNRHAIASWGPFAVEGDWVWRWKDRIDRRFVARYVPPAVALPATPASTSE